MTPPDRYRSFRPAAMVSRAPAPVEAGRPSPQAASEALSMTKRYFTSLFSMRS